MRFHKHILSSDNGFGIPVPSGTPASYTTASGIEYMCLNTELQQDDYVTAVEFYMAVGGYVYLNVSYFSFCLNSNLWGLNY